MTFAISHLARSEKRMRGRRNLTVNIESRLEIGSIYIVDVYLSLFPNRRALSTRRYTPASVFISNTLGGCVITSSTNDLIVALQGSLSTSCPEGHSILLYQAIHANARPEETVQPSDDREESVLWLALHIQASKIIYDSISHDNCLSGFTATANVQVAKVLLCLERHSSLLVGASLETRNVPEN